MAKFNVRGSVLGTGTAFKVIVPPSSSGQILPPTGQKQGDPYADGTLTTNGTGTVTQLQCTRITCQASGAVALFDANVVGSAVAANSPWGKTVVAGDIYVVDQPFANGVYITTDATARVSVCCV